MFKEVLSNTFELVRDQIASAKKENKDVIQVSQYCLEKRVKLIDNQDHCPLRWACPLAIYQKKIRRILFE